MLKDMKTLALVGVHYLFHDSNLRWRSDQSMVCVGMGSRALYDIFWTVFLLDTHGEHCGSFQADQAACYRAEYHQVARGS